VLDRDDALRKSGSVGVPPPFYSLRIVGDDGKICRRGDRRDRGPRPDHDAGYYNRPEETARALRDGWLFTGDLGYVDEDGFLYLVDRKKDMIDSGGVKVYPKDIEEVAARHPSIREVAVFGIPHDKWGETPVAAVVLREPGCADAGELCDWINARVAAKYQRVDRVLVLAEFPRNTAGKTLKRELRAPFWEGRAKAI
jgi:acyl-CoA synthetase (AMP-forming)/AMP-acid ligase II